MVIEMEYGVVSMIIRCEIGGVIMSAGTEDSDDCAGYSSKIEQGACAVFVYKGDVENNKVSLYCVKLEVSRS